MTWSIFIYVVPILPTKFQVYWHFGSGVQNRFSRWWPWIWIKPILVIFDLQVALIIPTKFQVNWPFGQEKIIKTDFQDGSHGSQFRFRIRTILAIFFIYKSRQYFLPSSGQLAFRFRRSSKQTFKMAAARFPFKMISAIFDLQVAQILPTKVQGNWPFGSGEAQNWVSR